MKNQRIFFAFFCIAYALLSATGIFLFGRPGYSKEYLANNHEDHKRYLAISKNPLYQKYCERPLLNPLDQHLQKEADFAVINYDYPKSKKLENVGKSKKYFFSARGP